MGFEMGCQWANHSRAICGAAVPCGETLGVSFWNEGFRWCTTAAHNQARRLAWLAGSFGTPGGRACPEAVLNKEEDESDGGRIPN